MTIIDYSLWAPDLATIANAPRVIDAKNVIPRSDHYAPLPSLTATTSALTGGACRGNIAARDADQAAHMYAGTETTLEELEGGTAWTDRTRSSGGAYALNSNSRWRFTTFGDRLLATNGVDEVQYIDMSTAATTFEDLPGLSTTAKFIATYLEFVFLGALGSSGLAIKWSALGNSESWTPGTGQSDEQEFADGGNITGLASTKAALYVFQEKCIRRVIFVGGDVIMQIDKIVEGLGCIEPNSLVQFGQRIFFLAEQGWYVFDGESEPQPIGLNKFDQWWLDDSERSYWYNMSAVIDPRNHLIAIGYASNNSGAGTPDSVLFYNYSTGWPSYARVDHQILAHAQSVFTSIDDLTGDVDADYDISFDDPYWQGGAYYFAAFSTADKLASFSGSALEATLTLGVVPIFNGRRGSVEWIRPIADTTAATCAGGAQVRPGDAITYVSAVSQQASGRCPQRGVNGIYMAAQTVIPAGETWSYARGVEFMARQGGVR